MKRYSQWVLIKELSPKKYEKRWLCRCSCGRKRNVWLKNLQRGLSKSCGKHKKPWLRKYIKPAKQFREWSIWSGLKNRCFNPNNTAYKNYGQRGITVCNRWLGSNGFSNFYKDMGPIPSAKYTIERINNNWHYTPRNCKWIPKVQQSRNRNPNYSHIEVRPLYSPSILLMRHRIPSF